ncbi:MAG: L,D-transpeptidase family protein [Candidatus Pacebacteria bacterium]|nr:L,D-transpeptidase family protein [Candidatus Paceibacterota bacterium]
MISFVLRFFVILVASIAVVSGGLFLYENKITTADQKLPEYAGEYSVTSLTCLSETQEGSKVIIHFQGNQKALSATPQYSLQEFPQEGRSEILFRNVGEVNTSFLYNDVMVINNPLIEELNYEKRGDDFLVNIKRRGVLQPAQISTSSNGFIILLPKGDTTYPAFLDFIPSRDSTVFPAEQKIAVVVSSKNPLKEAFLFLQGRPQTAIITTSTPTTTQESQTQKSFQYEISFNEKLKKDELYKVRAIVFDEQGLGSAVTWEFLAQLPQQRGILGPDRFQYLGWWGQINTNQTRVRKEPTTKSDIMGELSTINRVKVLDEVAGEQINNNNHWYQIDGGKYARGYVFSEAVNPLPQPEPPKEFQIPQGVKEKDYWIDVDTKKEIFTLFQYDKPVFATFVSTGRKGSETIEGTYSIRYKLIKKRMKDNPPNFEHGYDIPDVPSVMFYHDSYAIHGTYWHDRFGTQQSAGCTNMTQGDAKFVFDKILPKLNGQQTEVVADAENPGTMVHNHQ